jgi:peptidyl-prolyl cis-trans isomerase B (cyclophilin B)
MTVDVVDDTTVRFNLPSPFPGLLATLAWSYNQAFMPAHFLEQFHPEIDSNAVVLKTSLGDIKIALDFDNAPETAKNFQQYVEEGHYNGTIFHRVIKGFMAQGGGFAPGLEEKETRASIKNEANNGLSNKRGSLAMARTQEPHSASAQFFINLTDNNFLDFTAENIQGWGYCVFGEVVEGMDIVDKMTLIETGNMYGHGDVPKDDIVIESAIVE